MKYMLFFCIDLCTEIPGHVDRNGGTQTEIINQSIQPGLEEQMDLLSKVP